MKIDDPQLRGVSRQPSRPGPGRNYKKIKKHPVLSHGFYYLHGSELGSRHRHSLQRLGPGLRMGATRSRARVTPLIHAPSAHTHTATAISQEVKSSTVICTLAHWFLQPHHFLDLMKLLVFCRFLLMRETDEGRLASSAWMSPRLSWSKPVATTRKAANPIRKPSKSGVAA